MVKRTTETRIVINGKKYNSLNELPPEEREQLERAMNQVRKLTSGRIFRFAFKILGGKAGFGEDMLRELGLEDKNVIDVTARATVSGEAKPLIETSTTHSAAQRAAQNRPMTQPVKFEGTPLWPILLGGAAVAAYFLFRN